MDIKKGQIDRLKGEYLTPSENNALHVAIEDSFDGVVRVEPVEFAYNFKPINDWSTAWVEVVQ